MLLKEKNDIMKFSTLLLLTVLGFSFFSNCFQGQNYTIKEVPKEINNKYKKFYNLTKLSFKKQTGYVVNYLPSQYSIKGDQDFTKFIQKAINENDDIIFPNFPVKINKEGLMIPSNKNIYFDINSRIIFSGPALTRESDVLKIYKSQNVKIYNPTIEGSKFIKNKQEGEWSAGIAIYGAENIEIYNVNIYNTYGDGIIIGDNSKNVTVDGGKIDQTRRDGISITSGQFINILNLVISNINGTLPETGIQIEPNFPTDYISDIKIENIIGFNNKNGTLGLNLSPMNQEVYTNKRNVTIDVNNITDYYSNYTIGFSMNPQNLQYTPTGQININNIKSISSNNFLWQDSGKTRIKVNSQNLLDKQKKIIKIKY